MKLRKMYNTVILGMVILLIATFILLFDFNALVTRSQKLNHDGLELIALSNEMLQVNDYLVKLMRVFVINNDAALLVKYDDLHTYDNLEGKLNQMLDIGLAENEVIMLNKLFPLLKRLSDIEASAIAAYHQGNLDMSEHIIFDQEYINADFELVDITNTLIASITERVDNSIMELQKRVASMKVLITLFIGLSLICLIVLQVIQRNRVLKPVMEIEKITNEIASGIVDSRLVKRYDDEIGSLVEHVNKMADSIEAYMKDSSNSQRILENILNGMDAYVYVTDPATDIVLFINKKMEEHFGIDDGAVGRFCYDVLQDGATGRCEFCPCYQLDKDPGTVVVWEEHNEVTQRTYRNTDCYIEWLGGLNVHLQHSVDITDLKTYMNDKLVAEREALELKHKKEKAEESARAKGDFLAKMSHEIRTPMNAVMGMSELILRKDLPPDVFENATVIRNASSNLLAIINDILDFSKIESGMMEIVEAEYELASLINDILGIIRIRLIDKPVQFVANISPDIPAILWGDEIRIRQLLINLLSNAVKYTNEGHIALTATGAVKDDMVTLTISVEDTGVGVKEEDVGKLFGDFVQIDATVNKGIEGTGLGLAISRNLCRMMNGDIAVSSKYGLGSVFTITLPQRFEKYHPFAVVENPGEKTVLLYETRVVYRDSIMKTLDGLNVPYENVDNIPDLFERMPEYSFVFVSSFLYGSLSPVLSEMKNPPKMALLADITEASTPRNVRVLTLPAHSLSVANVLNDVDEDFGRTASFGSSFTASEARILIVDDVTANLKVAEGLLMPYEMQVTLCSGGREAVALVTENQYDLVFMDHMMPEMDGLEATAHIRDMEGDYFQNLPIIALTANAVSGVREMFVQNGMNDFLAKPIETAKLDAILERWIPKEKRNRITDSDDMEGESAFVNKLRNVSELSVDKALSVVGGSSKTYERIIKLSVRLLPENIESLNRLIETSLSNYAIEVHGVKGVLNNLGAYHLGLMALELEEHSKHGEEEECRAAHPSFISKLQAFSDIMQALLDEEEAINKPEGTVDTLLDAMPQLEEAVDFCDNVTALKVVNMINRYTYDEEIDKTIADMTDAFERFDFDLATELLGQLKGGLSEWVISNSIL